MNVLFKSILGALLLITGTGFAHAETFMVTGAGITSQPIGHYEFCRSNPVECSIVSVETAPLALTKKAWGTIVSVNRKVNETVYPLSDIEIYGKDEVWSYPQQGVGDCEDYVLEKRRILAAAGISLSDLLITVVRKRNGEGHAVLTLRTTKGDYILDNLTDEILPWEKTSYRFLKRQQTIHTGRWAAIIDRELITASTK